MRLSALVALAATLAAAMPARAQHAHHDGVEPVASSAAAPAGTRRQVAARTPATRVRTFSIMAHDYAFAMPDTIEAGSAVLKLDNHGKEMHHAWIARLDGGRTINDLLAAMKHEGPPPSWFVSIGGPNVAAPNGSAEATVLLTPGSYVALCFIPAPDGQPHIMKGMMKSFTVVPAKRTVPARLPAADNTITLNDYGFDFAKPLAAGRQVLRLANTATQPHEAVMFQLAPGKTATDVIEWVHKPAGPPPFLGSYGLTGIDQGIEANISVDLARGEYALICFVPDAKDGKPHFVHGMVRTVTVK